MTFLNAQTKNLGNDEGDVLAFFQNKLRNLIQRNGGDNSFSWIMEEFKDKDAPLPVGTKTRIKLTHSGHTITQIEKSFSTILLDFNVKLNQVIDVSADKNGLMKIFVGFKNAVEFYEDCRFWINGKLLDTYRQDELQRESFAYNSIKPRDAKATSKFSHSTWENVSQFSPSICGCYIDLKDIADGLPHKFTIELTIPFLDQLALQAWQLYPNSICGEIEEEVKTSLRAMVWAQINPNIVKETLQFLEDKAIDEEIPAVVPITRKFTQIGKPTVIISHYSATPTPTQTLHIKYQRMHGAKPYTAEEPAGGEQEQMRKDTHNDEAEPIVIDFHYTDEEFAKYGVDKSLVNHAEFAETIACRNPDYILNAGDSVKLIENEVKGALLVKSNRLNGSSINLKTEKLRLDVLGGTIQLGRSNLAGFGLKQGTYQGLVHELQTPLLVPSQELTREIFEGTAKANGLEISKTIPLKNATNITMMFPKSPFDITCFDNIMYQNVQLVVNKRTYPDTEFQSTCGARFYQHQLIANELDGALEATQEFEDSFTQPLNDPTTGKRYTNCKSDGTSFGINFQLERSNAGYVFDGLDTGTNSITITFRGQPLYRGDDDTYFIPDLEYKDQHPPSPEAWICSDTYFAWSVNGVEYFPRGVPAGFE